MTTGIYTDAIYKFAWVQDSYYVDFANQLSSGETLGSPTVAAYLVVGGTRTVATSTVIGSGSLAPRIQNTQVIFWYQAGSAGSHYSIAVEVTTSLGRQLEGNVDLFVIEEI